MKESRERIRGSRTLSSWIRIITFSSNIISYWIICLLSSRHRFWIHHGWMETNSGDQKYRGRKRNQKRTKYVSYYFISSKTWYHIHSFLLNQFWFFFLLFLHFITYPIKPNTSNHKTEDTWEKFWWTFWWVWNDN